MSTHDDKISELAVQLSNHKARIFALERNIQALQNDNKEAIERDQAIRELVTKVSARLEAEVLAILDKHRKVAESLSVAGLKVTTDKLLLWLITILVMTTSGTDAARTFLGLIK